MTIIDDINKLDPQNPGVWPLPARLFVFAIVFVGVLFAGWQFDITDKQETLAALEQKELEQMDNLKDKYTKAANLNILQEQMKVMQQSFGNMIKQLPSKTEVAGLLIDISQTGLSSGLEFKRFEPRSKILKEFYSELPINIVVKGDYHEFGKFVSDLAALPRIVTIHDIKITTNKIADKGESSLEMDVVAKTYQALDE